MGIYRAFSSLWGTNWIVGQYLLPILKEWGHREAGVILDLGCGESPFRHFFAHAKAYIRIDRIAVNDEVVIGDILDIPCTDSSVDTVLLFQVLADIPQPLAGLKEIARVLKPCGHLILFESMCYPEHDMPDDYFRIMPAGAEFLALQAGFRPGNITRLGGFFTRVAMLWNTCAMGKLNTYVLLKPLGYTGILICNVLGYLLDRIMLYPQLASDYVALFVKEQLEGDGT